MKDILKFVKKHSHKIVSVVIVIFLIILAILVKNFFFPSDNGVYYGTRLDGITKVNVKFTDEELVKYGITREEADNITDAIKKLMASIKYQLEHIKEIEDEFPPEAMIYRRKPSEGNN